MFRAAFAAVAAAATLMITTDFSPLRALLPLRLPADCARLTANGGQVSR
jgi:hypothetical protein